MIFLLLTYGFISVVLFTWIYLLYDSRKLKVPGPTPLPLLGNALLFLGDSAHFVKAVDNIVNTYGNDVTRIYLFCNRYVVFSHPKYIEPLMSSMDLITKGRSYDYLRPWLGEGLLTSTGYRWRSHRKFLTPAFHFNILHNFVPVFHKNSKVLLEKLSELSKGEPVSLFPIIALNALDNVTESIMGVNVNAQKDSESKYVKSIGVLSEIVSLKMRNPFVADDNIFNLLPYKTQQDKALKVLHGQTMKVIEARREELARNNITSLPSESETGIKNKHAFLDLLLLAEIDGHKIDDESIREEVDTFMFEGHDTTTSAVVFSLYCISKDEKVQEKIIEEQKSILGDDLTRDATFGELQQMKYLENVIKEALRLYPSVPYIERMVTKDTVLEGVLLPRNTSAVVNILGLQRREDLFEDALSFKPERYVNPAMKSAFAWIPFSAGPRNCIGQKFAMMEMKINLSAIVRNFVLLPGDEAPELNADLILRSKNEVCVRFAPRK